MRYIGLDVHKNNTTACIIANNGKPVTIMDVRSDEAGLQKILDHMDGQEFCVMMESSTYSYKIYRFFSKHDVEAHVVHARSLRIITESDKKTDSKDAESIGRYLRLWKRGDIDLSMSYIPTEEECALKDLCRLKEENSRKLADESRRIKSHMSRNLEEFNGNSDLNTNYVRNYLRDTYSKDFVLMARLDEYERLKVQGNELKILVERQRVNERYVDLLESIPGVGRQTAVQLMSMIVDPNRFPDSERFCAYFGMVPRVRDSGGKEHHGKLTKTGDKMMRSIMERVTSSHVRFCDSSVTRYFKAKEAEMGTKKAMVTASRKMMTMILAILKRGTPFRA
ncbi:MAG: IS110 family transposase [Candidatus Methanomethylophilaceae archaeon]|nr:IS110 family transposase [Candidatus Methanomethylophilaceae archaeon]MDY5872489.1 IS110 family transposase [Candidatus Methanomethylophilaceae archaeon]